MYTTQTEMTFSKADLDKRNFAKGKNEGKLCHLITCIHPSHDLFEDM